MHKFKQKFTIKVCINLTIAVLILFIIINFAPFSFSSLQKVAPNSTILDFQMGITPDRAFELLDFMGYTGRAYYRLLLIRLDFIFPLGYGLCVFAWLIYLQSKLNTKPIYNLVLFFPWLTTLSDWIENIGTLTMINDFPYLPQWAVFSTGIGVTAKLIFAGISLFSLLIFIILVHIKGKKAVQY